MVPDTMDLRCRHLNEQQCVTLREDISGPVKAGKVFHKPRL